MVSFECIFVRGLHSPSMETRLYEFHFVGSNVRQNLSTRNYSEETKHFQEHESPKLYFHIPNFTLTLEFDFRSFSFIFDSLAKF